MRSCHLRLVEEGDARFILDLRCNPQRGKHLSPVENDLDKQIAWIRDYKLREKAGVEYYVITELRTPPHTRFGTARMYNICPDSFTIGSWLLAPEVSRVVGIEMVLGGYDFGFNILNLEKAYLDVRRTNIQGVRFHERFGLTRIGEDDVNVYFELPREAYAKIRPQYARFLEY
jgi:RimJ/RimL family protein N-acetyltransferase